VGWGLDVEDGAQTEGARTVSGERLFQSFMVLGT
jgi:hypothetical protein